ncbi:hypothetical protein R6Q59_010537 [Mikania micrantha]
MIGSKTGRTGLVIAQRFGVIVHLFSSRGAQTIFPFWTSANSLVLYNVVSVVHLGVHFINVTLQGYYPIPTVNPNGNVTEMMPHPTGSSYARRNGSQLPPFPEPRVYPDDGSSAGPSGGS